MTQFVELHPKAPARPDCDDVDDLETGVDERPSQFIMVTRAAAALL